MASNAPKELPAQQEVPASPMAAANVMLASPTMEATALVAPMEPSGVLKLKHAFSYADRTQFTTPLSDHVYAIQDLA